VRRGTSLRRIAVLGQTRLYSDCLVRALKLHAVTTLEKEKEGYGARAVGPAPDIILIDLPPNASLAAIRQLRSRYPNAALFGINVSDDDEILLNLIRAGLDTLLVKDTPLETLEAAIERCARGQPGGPTDIFERIARRLASGHGQPSMPRPLSAREREVLGLVGQGLTNKEIARRLGVETVTVKNHVHNIMAKFLVHRRLDAAAQLPDPPTEQIE